MLNSTFAHSLSVKAATQRGPAMILVFKGFPYYILIKNLTFYEFL